MKLSLIVTAYNLEIDILLRCINSINEFIKNNDYFVEVIVIDDGSEVFFSEQYKETLKEFDIHYVRKNNGGVSSARNLGLKLATGDYITFIDGDDYISSDCIEIENFAETDLLILDMLLEENATRKLVRYNFIDKNTHYLNDFVNELIASDNMNSACAKFFKKKIIDENEITFDESMNTAEDQAFVIDYIQQIQRIKYINSIFYHYVRHSSSGEKRGLGNVKKTVTSLEKIRRKKISLVNDDENLIKVINSLYIEKLFRGIVFLKELNIEKYDKLFSEYAKVVDNRINFKAKIEKFILIGNKSYIFKGILCLKKVRDIVFSWRKRL